MAAFLGSEITISPYEFRLLSCEDADELATSLKAREGRAPREAALNPEVRQAALRNAVDEARQDGLQQGEREGRRAVRAELETNMQEAVARARKSLVDAVAEFHAMRERYFTDVEQEIVRLALAIAGRVLHREAQLDPLLLAGVVRVALEKMADRSGVVLRVAGSEVEAWTQMFHATEEAERPRVAEDVRLTRGECVLETRMGTVELGIGVQLEEIEKGFFDLLNHRPGE